MSVNNTNPTVKSRLDGIYTAANSTETLIPKSRKEVVNRAKDGTLFLDMAFGPGWRLVPKMREYLLGNKDAFDRVKVV